jgi:hypothetical protein
MSIYDQLIVDYNKNFPKYITTYKEDYNANNGEDTEALKNARKTLDDLISNMFGTINDLENDINDINKELDLQLTDINDTTKLNKSLTINVNKLDSDANGALELIDNSKEMYKKQYIINIAILVAFLIMGYYIYTLFL